MIITEAGIADAEDILNLQRTGYQSEAHLYDDFNLPPLTQTLAEMRASFADHTFLKAVIDERIVGTVRARVEKGTCHIGRLIVLPQYQRQGIGSALMASIEKLFPHVERFELFTGVKSTGNLRLYKRLGYEETKREAVSAKVVLVFMEKLMA
ncbi:MAG: GNAT family N-acetyltransferase [Proteobacteria bacterium]|nr:GNAT family N-acetyltransferase [Pseudomonadota bacterium]MBU4295355.1 GNAT family N-acetyltransferase [Pseudomonadota bacterium]